MPKDYTPVQTELFDTLIESKGLQIITYDSKLVMLACKPNQPLKNVDPVMSFKDDINAIHFNISDGFKVYEGPLDHVIILIDRTNEKMMIAFHAAADYLNNNHK